MTSSAVDDKLGKLAYDAYCTHSGGLSLVSGEPLPPWDGQTRPIQEAWISAARTVEAFVAGREQDDAV